MEYHFDKKAEQIKVQLVSWRRHLHQNPEVGLHLPQTMAYLGAELEKMGIAYTLHREISCIEATLGQGERCILLRADVDGLPIEEETDLEFRSQNGNFHGCGHDLHGAMLLGAAKLLKEYEQNLPGRVKLLFQSGEENFQGAAAAVEAGVLDGVHSAFAMHAIAMMPLGIALTGKQPMAAVDGFEINITGHGGHGSMPETAIDPINAAVQVYLALQSLMAREVGGTEEAVLTVGKLAAGETANVIPEQAVLQGTMRTFDEKLRRRLVGRVEQIAVAVATAYRCQCKVAWVSRCGGVTTDETVTALVRQAIEAVAPKMQISGDAHGMGSEDFAQITAKVPSAYFMLGAGPENPQKRYGQHHPKVEFNEEILPIGAAIFSRAALQWLEAQNA